MNEHSRTQLSMRARLLRHAVRWLIAPILDGSDRIADRRRRLERVTALAHLPLPWCTRVEPTTLRGVAAEWLRNVRVPARRTVLYFHGGAYVVGSPATHRDLTGRLATVWQAQVASIDYRLAPEHPYPAAIDDALEAYRALLEQNIAPRDIVIAGDSAGGGLSLACALRIRDSGLPLPGALVLFSPWIDLSMSGASVAANARSEDMLDAQVVQAFGRFYLGDLPATTPLASPLCADLHGLPRTLIQATDTEILLDDARRLLDTLHAAGTPAQLRVWPKLWHVWQLFAGKLPEADAALREAAAFLDQPADSA